MSKVHHLKDPKGFILIYCPGCESNHTINIDPANGSPCHTFSGTDESPTIRASILQPKDVENILCHSFVTDGRIQFLSDCEHKLAGNTVDLPDFMEQFNSHRKCCVCRAKDDRETHPSNGLDGLVAKYMCKSCMKNEVLGGMVEEKYLEAFNRPDESTSHQVESL